jgi:Domain of unknown function (DUF3336)
VSASCGRWGRGQHLHAFVQDAINEATRRSGGRDRQEPSESQYEGKLLSAKTAELKALRAGGRVQDLIFALRADLYRNFGNITNKCVSILICGLHVVTLM